MVGTSYLSTAQQWHELQFRWQVKLVKLEFGIFVLGRTSLCDEYLMSGRIEHCEKKIGHRCSILISTPLGQQEHSILTTTGEDWWTNWFSGAAIEQLDGVRETWIFISCLTNLPMLNIQESRVHNCHMYQWRNNEILTWSSLLAPACKHNTSR